MFTRFTLITAQVAMLIGFGCVANGQASAQNAGTNFDSLERVIRLEMKETETPGLAVVLVKGDEIVFAKGYGVSNLETATPVTAEMLFRVGTITKIFTAAALVSLAEEGRIDLNAPVGKYVKGLNSKLSRVTAHQLLTHTAGIKEEHQRYGLHDYAMLGPLIRSWKEDYYLTEPGRIYSHSNPGYVLAGLLIQEVAGKPFADVLDERWFKPVGMKRTTFRLTEVMTQPFTQSYRAFGGEELKVVTPYSLDAVGWPSGSMFSTAHDLARFAVAFVNGGTLEGKQVFAPSVIAKLSAPYVPVPGISTEQQTGYGVTVETHRGVRLLKSSGSWGGFTTLFWIAPEHRCAVVLLANRNAAFFNASAEKALSLLLPLQPAAREGRTTPLTMTRTEMSSYLGTYVNENVVEILLKDEKLWLKENDALQPITKLGDAHFSASAPGSRFTLEFFFVKGTNGKVEFLHRAGRALKKL